MGTVTVLSPLKRDLENALIDAQKSSMNVRERVLNEVPKQLSLLNSTLNRLVDIVSRNGYIDNHNRLHILTPQDLQTIMKTIETAFKLQNNLALLPTSFKDLSEHVGRKDDGTTPGVGGLPALPSKLTPIDTTS